MVRVNNPFDPLAPWPGDIDLDCNLIQNHGGIRTGCDNDWELIKSSAGNIVLEVLDSTEFVEIKSRLLVSETLDFTGTNFDVLSVRPTIDNVNVTTPIVWGGRISPNINIVSGGTGNSQIGGLHTLVEL